MHRLNTAVLKYLPYIVVLCVSFFAAWILPAREIIRDLATLPGIGALFLLLNQLYRDERTHERALELQYKQQDFILGTASHMSDVAYDKHVLFCEEYIACVQDGFQKMMADGPSPGTMTIGRDLARIRIKHSTWLTQDIDKKLKPFESALISIGAKESILNNLQEGEQRIRVVDEIYKSFGLVFGYEKPLNEEEEGVAIDRIIEQIREILGINILTTLRQESAKLALSRVQNQTK